MVGVQQKFLRIFIASNMRSSSIPHPKHGFEGIRLRNPTNTPKPQSYNILLKALDKTVVAHLRINLAQNV